MPLLKKSSKKAFESNLKAELGAGKPKEQSLAIAYDVQRRARGHKMAKGGMIHPTDCDCHMCTGGKTHMAEGGQVPIMKENYSDEDDSTYGRVSKKYQSPDQDAEMPDDAMDDLYLYDGGMITEDSEEHDSRDKLPDTETSQPRIFNRRNRELMKEDMYEPVEELSEGHAGPDEDPHSDREEDDTVFSRIKRKMRK